MGFVSRSSYVCQAPWECIGNGNREWSTRWKWSFRGNEQQHVGYYHEQEQSSATVQQQTSVLPTQTQMPFTSTQTLPFRCAPSASVPAAVSGPATAAGGHQPATLSTACGPNGAQQLLLLQQQQEQMSMGRVVTPPDSDERQNAEEEEEVTAMNPNLNSQDGNAVELVNFGYLWDGNGAGGRNMNGMNTQM